jgi:hypothetical protein
MQRLRTIPGFVRLLVAAFLLAQLAGTVSTSRADTHAKQHALATHAHHDHATDGRATTGSHRSDHAHAGFGDACCALHAFFSGVLPSLSAVDASASAGERLTASVDDRVSGIPPGRLDRPPRPRR